MSEPADDLAGDPVAERLARERPVPDPVFRGALGRELDVEGEPARPAALRRLVALYVLVGLALLALAALSMAGVGPLSS
jgi:hypothetical protein